LQQNPQSNIRPQLLAQPNPNPNNRPIQSVQIIESLDPEVELRECNEIKLRSGHIITSDEDKNMQPKIKETYLEKPSTVTRKQCREMIQSGRRIPSKS